MEAVYFAVLNIGSGGKIMMTHVREKYTATLVLQLINYWETNRKHIFVALSGIMLSFQ
jgi:hypothetical protein